LRALLSGDHERLDALFVELLDEFREGDPNDVRAMWARFETGLTAHLDAEERYLLPLFARLEPEEAAGLLAEHAVLRRTLDELGVGVDLHAVSLNVARKFVETLRAHAHHEDQVCAWRKLLYQWAERQQVEEWGQEREARA
jgi:hemerythrin-like domain-containing protein